MSEDSMSDLMKKVHDATATIDDIIQLSTMGANLDLTFRSGNYPKSCNEGFVLAGYHSRGTVEDVDDLLRSVAFLEKHYKVPVKKSIEVMYSMADAMNMVESNGITVYQLASDRLAVLSKGLAAAVLNTAVVLIESENAESGDDCSHCDRCSACTCGECDCTCEEFG